MTAADRDGDLGKDADKHLGGHLDKDIDKHIDKDLDKHLGGDADAAGGQPAEKAGKDSASKGNRLSCEFSRVPLEVISTAHRLGMPTKWAVLLYLCRNISEAGGELFAWLPASTMAEELHMTGNQVKNAVRELKRCGLIAVAKPGHKGRAGHKGPATVYRLCVGVGSEPHPKDSKGVGSEPHPKDAASSASDAAEGERVPQNPTLQTHRVGARTPPHKSESIYRYSHSLAGTTPPDGSTDGAAPAAWSGPRPMRRDPQVFHPARLGPDGRLGDILFGDGGCGDDGEDVG